MPGAGAGRLAVAVVSQPSCHRRPPLRALISSCCRPVLDLAFLALGILDNLADRCCARLRGAIAGLRLVLLRPQQQLSAGAAITSRAMNV
jgi:hypothetical protein